MATKLAEIHVCGTAPIPTTTATITDLQAATHPRPGAASPPDTITDQAG
jgi:hypothetical protein